MAMALAARTVNVSDLQEDGFVEPEAQALEGGKIDLVVLGGQT
jgi:hypothetical protein